MDKNAKLMEIFENEEFKAAVEGITSAEELQELFARHGLELTLDEINDLFAQAVKCMKEGEMEEGELEDVSGGAGAGTALKVGTRALVLLIKNLPIGGPILPVQPKKPGWRI